MPYGIGPKTIGIGPKTIGIGPKKRVIGLKTHWSEKVSLPMTLVGNIDYHVMSKSDTFIGDGGRLAF